MATDIDIRPIFSDFFHPFRFGGKRKFSVPHFLWTIVLPAAWGAWLSTKHPAISDKYQVTLLTAFGAIAAVMTALLPVVQYVVGADLQSTRYSESQRSQWQHQVDRLNVLRGLYSTISVSVILLVFALVPLTLLQVAWFPPEAKQAISASIYFVGGAVAISFLQVVSGVYLVLNAQASQIDQRLKDLAPKG
jgi:hypothetical protein